MFINYNVENEWSIKFNDSNQFRPFFQQEKNNQEFSQVKLLPRMISHPHQCSWRAMTSLSLRVLKQFYHLIHIEKKKTIKYQNSRPLLLNLKLDAQCYKRKQTSCPNCSLADNRHHEWRCLKQSYPYCLIQWMTFHLQCNN